MAAAIHSGRSIWQSQLEEKTDLEGRGDLVSGLGDLVSRLIMGIAGMIIWLMGVLKYLPSPHDPPSRGAS